MHAHYGRIPNTKGLDGEPLDFYLGDRITRKVFRVSQMKAPDFKKIDEHKYMLGYKDRVSAVRSYLKHYPSKKFMGKVDTMGIESVRSKLREKVAQREVDHLYALTHGDMEKAAFVSGLMSGARRFVSSAASRFRPKPPPTKGGPPPIPADAKKATTAATEGASKATSQGSAAQTASSATPSSATPSSTPVDGSNPSKSRLFSAGNIAKGALVGGGALALYGGYKGIDAAHRFATDPIQNTPMVDPRHPSYRAGYN